MRPYRTNSPLYLNYIASTKTRLEILDDPRLCVLLNEPSIKENMEIACAYNEAEWGDLQSKIEFVEYFFCNGPELDADTIIYYRSKILQDPTYTSIAHYYFNDFDKIDTIRENKYGKKKNKDNCFQSPCNYLGRFGAGIGLMGDKINAQSTANSTAAKAAYLAELEKEMNRVINSGGEWTEKLEELFEIRYNEENRDKVAPRNESKVTAFSRIKAHLRRWLIPETIKSCETIKEYTSALMDLHISRMRNASLIYYTRSIGDPYAIDMADATQLMVKANVKRNLGDCARLWEHARRLKMFSIAENTQTPIPPEAEASGKNVDGTPKGTHTGATTRGTSKDASSSRGRAFNIFNEWNAAYAWDRLKNGTQVNADVKNNISELELFIIQRGKFQLEQGYFVERKRGLSKKEFKDITDYYNNLIKDKGLLSKNNSLQHQQSLKENNKK